MIQKGTLSIRGLFDWDPSVFNGMIIPEGLNRNAVIHTILSTCDRFQLIYPDWEVMKDEIGWWSIRRQYEWKTLYETTIQEYNPIENYDRMERWEDLDKKDEKRVGSSNTKSDYTTVNEGDSTTIYTPKSSNTSVTSGKAFNNTSFVDTEKVVTSQDGADNTKNTTNTNVSGEDLTEAGSTDTFTTDNSLVREGRSHGNIGVTTTQQMLEQERQIAIFSIYDAIAESFKNTFCSLCYI